MYSSLKEWNMKITCNCIFVFVKKFLILALGRVSYKFLFHSHIYENWIIFVNHLQCVGDDE